MTENITLIIPGPPGIKKNKRKIMMNFRTGKPFIGKNERAANIEEMAIMVLKDQKNKLGLKTITEPVNAKFSFYLPTKRRVDLSNLLGLPEDALEKSGIIENDCLIHGLDGSRKFYDKENPRTEIEITPLDEN
jgi:Holliday junction resolvase RusA-like endonuclease